MKSVVSFVSLFFLSMTCFVLSICLLVSCAPSIDLTGWPCGENGECGADHTCNAGFCERISFDVEAKKPNTILFVVGVSCRKQSDCRGKKYVSAKKICKLSDNAHTTWPKGYCTLICKKDSDCNPDSVPQKTFCLKKNASQKEGECRRACEKDDDCRTSYTCQKLSSHSLSICVPA